MIKRPATIQAELRYRVEIRSLRRRRTDCGPSCPRYASAQTALLGRRKTSCLKGWALSPSILSDRRRSPRPTAPQMPRHRLRSIAFDSINSKHALGAPRCWRATVSLQQSHKVGSSRVQSESSRSGSQPTPLMELAVSSVGWSATGSRRISRCAMPASAMMGPSHAATFAGTSGAGSTSAPTTRCCIRSGPWTTAPCSAIAPQSSTAMFVHWRMQCCPNMIARQVPRDIHEDARDLARRLMGTQRFLKSRDERKRVEMRFAHLKTHHGFEREGKLRSSW